MVFHEYESMPVPREDEFVSLPEASGVPEKSEAEDGRGILRILERRVNFQLPSTFGCQ